MRNGVFANFNFYFSQDWRWASFNAFKDHLCIFFVNLEPLLLTVVRRGRLSLFLFLCLCVAAVTDVRVPLCVRVCVCIWCVYCCASVQSNLYIMCPCLKINHYVTLYSVHQGRFPLSLFLLLPLSLYNLEEKNTEKYIKLRGITHVVFMAIFPSK